ncbi:extensin family protein [soil metagenome]
MGLAAVLLLAGCGRLIPHGPAPGQTTGPRPYLPGSVSTPSGDNLIDRPIDGGTFGRLQRATGDIETCAAVLGAARVTFSPTPDRVNSETCGLTQAGVLGPDYGTRARMAPANPTTTCALAAAISVWRRQSVEPAAREILGVGVDQIDHFGVYACRPVNSQAGNRHSAHSRAAALDFAGVRLSDGRRITVTDDWNTTTPEGRFLHRIRDDACQVFGTTLSPDYNALHHDHLHLEAESGRLCR